jgi:tetratricopeptide (TPR) repeat protein
MSSFSLKHYIIPATFIVIGFAVIFLLSGYIENQRPELPKDYEDDDLVFQGAKLKGFSLGLNGLVADWYWMQSLQYLGGKLAKKPDAKINVADLREFNPKLLYPLLDNAVSFDPQFIGVYEYGAVVLPSIDPAFAVNLVNKGIESNPNEWRLYNHLGYIYWKHGNYELASNAYLKASEIEGSSPLMKSMVAKMKTDGGSRETAREIYEQMLESAADSSIKRTAELFLLNLDALDEIDAINTVLKSKSTETRVCVGNIQSIIPELMKVALPNNREFRVDKDRNIVDPSGAPYILNRDKCVVELDKAQTKLPLN